MNDWDWSGIIGLLAVAIIFGLNGKEIDYIFQGDEAMDEKIKSIKTKILDKVENLVGDKELTLDEYSKVLSILSQIGYDPKYFMGFNTMSAAKSEDE